MNSKYRCMALALWLIFVSAVSPSYLVEGGSNLIGLSFPSKDTYVYTVMAANAIYILITVILLIPQSIWKKHRIPQALEKPTDNSI